MAPRTRREEVDDDEEEEELQEVSAILSVSAASLLWVLRQYEDMLTELCSFLRTMTRKKKS